MTDKQQDGTMKPLSLLAVQEAVKLALADSCDALGLIRGEDIDPDVLARNVALRLLNRPGSPIGHQCIGTATDQTLIDESHVDYITGIAFDTGLG
jgi:hypothetical protein